TRPRYSILPLSARDASGLPVLAERFRRELAPDPRTGRATDLTDLGHTLAHRRQHHDARLSVVYSSPEDLDEALAAHLRGEEHPRVLLGGRKGAEQPRLAWVFTGMGPQWWGMGRTLYASQPVYREAVLRCDREIAALTGWSLVKEMDADEADSRMADTWLAQPANFAVQIGLAALWRAHGVRPDAIVGHSTGEIAAFHEAGIYSLRDAARIVVHRSRLQQRLAGTGRMLAVGLSEEEAARRLKPYGERVSVAAVNGPASLTLAGDGAALAELAGGLRAERLFATFLATDVPYHSAAMDAIRDELLDALAGIAPRPAGVPLYLTAREGLAQGPELGAAYWWDNVRDPVRFRSAVERMADDGHRIFLEIGPHPVLAHSIRECLADGPGDPAGEDVVTLPSMRRGGDEEVRFTTSLAALHTLGRAIDWSVPHPRGRVVPLPRYPWRRDRYWTEPEPVAQIRLGLVDHPLLGRRLATAEPAWEALLDTETAPYLADHRIQGQVLFPAAGYLEMAAQAVRAMTGGTHAALGDIELRKALFLPEGAARAVQLSFSSEHATFTVATGAGAGAGVGTGTGAGAGDAGEPAVHARGTVRAGARPPGGAPALDADAVRKRATRHHDAAACYAGLGTHGYAYGPAFQGIAELWTGPGEALARIRPPQSIGDAAARHHVHPVLLDACFQTLLAAGILAERAEDGGRSAPVTGLLLPLSIAEVRTAPVGHQPLWAHATVTRRGDGELVGDIALFGEDGVPLGHVGGFRAADVAGAPAEAGPATIDGWLAEPAWVQTPHDAATEADRADAAPAAGDWLLFADAPGGVADALGDLVTARGGHCHLVRPGDAYAFGAGTGVSTVVPGDAAHVRRLLADLAGPAAPGPATPEPAAAMNPGTVVHLWNLALPPLDATGRRHLEEHAATGAYSLVALAQALADDPRQSASPAALHLVTRGAQATAPGEGAEPLPALAWGVGRVLRQQELTSHPGTLIDLTPARDGDAAPGPRAEAEALLREFLPAPPDPGRERERGPVEDEIALRPGRRLAARLVRPEGLTRPLPLRLRPDGAYLVTGAFGALGRVLCRFLVRRGARHLVLAGRTPLPDRETWRGLDPASAAGGAARFVKELEALGAHPVLAAVDVADERALTAWLDAYRRRDAPPLRGVFHLAGHVRDTPLPRMDRGAFDAVLAPKAAGAWLLHHHLRDEPLDHFVLFASVASLLTTRGQTNYAAGNAFLDALAHHRRARGLPALSLDWGPWATGMIEELGLTEHYRVSRGMSSLTPGAGMATLERVIGQDRPQLLIATIVDWKVFLAWYPSPPALVGELAAEATADDGRSAEEHGGFLDAFRTADGERRAQLAAERFTALAGAVLRVPEERIASASSLGALGLDSLLAMELRARVLAETGAALPVVALLSGAPAHELVAQLHDALTALAEEAEEAERDGPGERGEGAGASGGAAAAVELHEDPARHPLTQNQKALWFLKQLNPEGFAYNIGGAVEVRAPLDPELMFAAMGTLVARHPMLRASFALQDGQPVQRIGESALPDVGLFDVQDLEWDEVHAMIVTEYRRPYDLERDPLIRLRLFRRAPDRWIIMKAVHHIISDAVSTFTFIEELLALYEGLRSGRPVELPPVPARYLDFLNRQNRLLASPAAGRMLAYWRDSLPAEVPALDLPTDRPRPAVQTHNGASEFFVLDAELSAGIHALARKHDVTVFMVLLSAYHVLLHRYSGQRDIVVGSPVTGRSQEEFASVYGYFVNPLPLYADLSGSPSVAALLAQVRARVLGGLDHQEYPFVLLVQELGLRHDPSRSAVFQAMFILLAHRVATEQYGYRLDYIELPEEEGQFDLTLSAYEDEAEQRFHCVLKYNTDLFLPATVRRMCAHYTALLESFTRAGPEQPADRLEMLGAAEREAILRASRGRAVPHDQPVHRLITRAAERSPDAVALTVPAAPASAGGPGRSLTYRELEHRARLLAREVRERGVGAGGVVAVSLPKSPELIVSLLAILKTGAAYLPLDPDHPVERLAFMIGQAGTGLVLTDAAGRERLAARRPTTLAPGAADAPPDAPPDAPVDVLAVDGLPAFTTPAADLGAMPPDPDEDPDRAPADPDAPAYVIHTSGSTGRPKAVRVSHRSLAAVHAAWREEYGLDAAPGTHLQMAGVSFDVFTGDLVRALCSGGRLVLVGRDLLFDTAGLHAAMTAEGVDCAEFVPAIARALMTHCENGGHRLDFMRLLIVGSDTWKVGEYERLRALCGPGTRVINSYGLTEAAIDSACFEGRVDGLDPHQAVPIGAPLPNCSLHILDEPRDLVPPGVVGELWVGGAGVALGYAGDAEQTARRFVTLTLSREPGAGPERLYRTGDLARRDAQGRVHLIGRADSQVKLHGHRVEPGEIESLLTALPGVDQAAVTVRDDARGEPALRAYWVPAPGARQDSRALRRHLATRLPTYLIPAHFTALDALPLTPNGKVDLAALPEPGPEEAEEAYEPPVTLYERSMAAHWEALLGCERPGLRDDFFESGGSSIALIELIHRLRTEFGVTIAVGRLFKVTTLHGMARTVEDIITGRITGVQSYLTFNPGYGPALFCFPPAGGHGLVYRGFAAHLPRYELIAFNHLDGDKVVRYADLVERLRPEGPCPVLGYSLGGNLAFEVAKELERRGREVPHVVIMDSYRILEAGLLTDEHVEAFEHELRDHLRRHTGSDTVTAETLAQAREYLDFCARTPNLGAVAAAVTVISDEAKAALYAPGRPGSWDGSSTTRGEVLPGSGTHAEMLDEKHAERNAALVLTALRPPRNAPPLP
ncbi:non-ribosomal peptide synthetase, partial [Streptomyces sp. SBT349]|uniref:non-ribosomal peptide synthetase n=1 Tax=Streptomyces sp. SBT349 TaxID=1580539 RepID=UPI00066E8D5E